MLALVDVATTQQAAAQEPSRFFYSGDGQIKLFGAKTGASYDGNYRQGQKYDTEAIKAISRVFGAPYRSNHNEISLRLIEFLDLLQDRLAPDGRLTITSGYRSPSYNTSLRNKGKLAAKASLHQYGMAADLKLKGVSAKKIWEYVKELGYGGAGYYQGKTVHIDMGPARSWDEKTSGVGTGISADNKLIGLITDFDRYRPGEIITLRFIRMTAFPIGVVQQFELIRPDIQGRSNIVVTQFEPSFANATDGECPVFSNIDQMARIRWRISKDLPSGHYQIRTQFCGQKWPDMPKAITTAEFEINRP
jgi:uncharacterized protein YcbK (DUF882 family)